MYATGQPVFYIDPCLDVIESVIHHSYGDGRYALENLVVTRSVFECKDDAIKALSFICRKKIKELQRCIESDGREVRRLRGINASIPPHLQTN